MLGTVASCIGIVVTGGDVGIVGGMVVPPPAMEIDGVVAAGPTVLEISIALDTVPGAVAFCTTVVVRVATSALWAAMSWHYRPPG